MADLPGVEYCFDLVDVAVEHRQARVAADELYEALAQQGISVLYDDRDERAGAKFADAELMGIPYRVTVSDRLLADETYELTERMSGKTEVLTRQQLLAKLN